MILTFFLKTLCDISYYMCFAALIGSRFGVSSYLIYHSLLLSVCASVFMTIYYKGWKPFLRFLPMAVAIADILLLNDIPTIIVLVPAAFYIAYVCLKRRFHPEYNNCVNSFITLTTLLGVIVSLICIFDGSNALQVHSVSFIFIYLLGMILVLRMLRQSEEILNKPSFIIMNSLTIASVLFLSIVIFSDAGMKLIKTSLLILYKVTIVPFVYIVGPIIAGVSWVVVKLISLIIALVPPNMQHDNIEDGGINELEKHLTSNPPKGLLHVLYAIFIAALLFFIIRRLMNRHSNREKSDASVSYSYITPERNKISLPSLIPKAPAECIRYYYRRFMLHYINSGVTLTNYMDTSEIEHHCCSHKPEQADLIKRMRLLYQPARYGGRAEKKDADEAKSIYRSMKKASKS